MHPDIDHKALYDRFAAKVKIMRALQRQQQKQGNWFPKQDRDRLYRVTREVDNMLLLDDTGKKVFLKNN